MSRAVGSQGQACPRPTLPTHPLFGSQMQADPHPSVLRPTGGSDCPAEPGPSIQGHFVRYGFCPAPASQKLKGLGSQTRD